MFVFFLTCQTVGLGMGIYTWTKTWKNDTKICWLLELNTIFCRFGKWLPILASAPTHEHSINMQENAISLQQICGYTWLVSLSPFHCRDGALMQHKIMLSEPQVMVSDNLLFLASPSLQSMSVIDIEDEEFLRSGTATYSHARKVGILLHLGLTVMLQSHLSGWSKT